MFMFMFMLMLSHVIPYASAYTKVYESVCPVGVGVHCDALPEGSPVASGCETPPKKTRGENPRSPVARFQSAARP